MTGNLAHWVHAARGKRVLLIGDLILDRYLYGDAERISPEAPVPVLRAVEKREAVGGSANVAACLVALGCEVVCCGVVGGDSAGMTLRGLLNDIGVQDGCLLRIEDRPTTTKTRLVGLAQHRHRQQLLRVDEEVTAPLPEVHQSTLRERIRDAMGGVDIVCIEDYNKGLIGHELAADIISDARRAGLSVLVDPARLRDYRRYENASILTPNRAELSLVADRALDDVAAIPEAALGVIEQIRADAMVVTADRDGCVVVRTDGGWEHIPTVPRSVYDNTGAGDAVLAMLAAATAAGAGLEDAARLANVAGGLEVEKFGCVPISSEEILAELRLEDRLRNGKLRSVDELVAELNLRRDRGESVAFTNGCFDILHAGHVDFLQRCRREGSMLVVGLNDDDSVRAQGKANNRPINSFADRARVLAALECVDYVVGFGQPTPEALIRQLRPDVLCKGADWAEKGVVGRDYVEAMGGRVKLLPLVEGLSTTELIRRIRDEAASHV